MYLRGVPAREMRVLLDFMYTGQTDLPRSHVKPLLETAEALKIKGLGVTLDQNLLQFPHNQVIATEKSTSRPVERQCEERNQHQQDIKCIEQNKRKHFDENYVEKKRVLDRDYRIFDDVDATGNYKCNEVATQHIVPSEPSPKRRKCTTTNEGNSDNNTNSSFLPLDKNFKSVPSQSVQHSHQHHRPVYSHQSHHQQNIHHHRQQQLLDTMSSLVHVKSERDSPPFKLPVLLQQHSNSVTAGMHKQQSDSAMHSLASILNLEEQEVR